MSTSSNLSSETDLTAMYSNAVEFLKNNVERVFRLKPCPNISDFEEFDQLHYLGHEPLDYIIKKYEQVSKGSESSIIEVGAGVGGPARYISSKTGGKVRAFEIQREMCWIGESINSAVGLSHLVPMEQLDILSCKESNCTDLIFSLLCFLHIKDKSRLFTNCKRMLKPKGIIVIEDYFKLTTFTEEECNLLSSMVSSVTNDMHSQSEYIGSLKSSGFTNIQFEDMTEKWKSFVTNRLLKFAKNYQFHCEINGEAVTSRQLAFFQAVADLFIGGRLGGCRITATIE